MIDQATFMSEITAFSETHKLKIQVDYDLCVGFGDCVEAAPQIFALNDENLAIILDPDASTAEVLHEAAEVCPVSAILLFDRQGKQVAPQA